MAAHLSVGGGGAGSGFKRGISRITAEREAAEQEALGVLEKEVCRWLSQTCLLYTSPSPRDATLSRMPSSA